MFKEAIEAQQKVGDEYQWPQMTIGHLCGAVFSMHREEDAAQFYSEYVEWLRNQPDLKQPAETIARANIGWFFGEGMPDTDRAMWRKVGASHPVFGGMETIPSPQEAFAAGVRTSQTKAK